MKKVRGMEQFAILLVVLALGTMMQALPGKAAVNGNYQGIAKNRAGENIDVTFELTEKDGAMSGMIRSSHGDFAISGGTHKGDAVTLEFDANGASGTITLHANGDKLEGTWSAGDDGGAVDVKKSAAQEEAPKGKP